MKTTKEEEITMEEAAARYRMAVIVLGEKRVSKYFTVESIRRDRLTSAEVIQAIERIENADKHGKLQD